MKKSSFALLLVCLILFICLPVEKSLAVAIPTITIQGVTEDEKVTIKTNDFPADKTFRVRMGLFGTKGVDGVLVDTVDSGDGGSLVFTFEIPTSLHHESLIAIRLESTTSGHFAYNWFNNQTFGDHDGSEDSPTIPSITALTVKAGENVIIETYNLPADETFIVRMDEFGTEAKDGIEAASFDSGEGGTLTEVFPIPESLKDAYKIDIRIDSEDSDVSAYTWFINQTGTSGGTGSATFTGIPTISITAVDEGVSVSIKTNNFPTNKDFIALMGEMGTKGVNGIQVASFNSEGGGIFTKTFNIPASLASNTQIAIRLQTTNGAYYAYNWFYNNSTGTSPSSPSNGTTPYTGIPTFGIQAVIQNDSVTIRTNNFPANIDFRVLMGEMGTKGIGGIIITTINSGSGGTLEETFNIPAALVGRAQIAIRLEANTGGYYAYNWFDNQTVP